MNEGDCPKGETPLWLTKPRQARPSAKPLAHQKSSHTPPTQYDRDIPLPGFLPPQDRKPSGL